MDRVLSITSKYNDALFDLRASQTQGGGGKQLQGTEMIVILFKRYLLFGERQRHGGGGMNEGGGGTNGGGGGPNGGGTS